MKRSIALFTFLSIVSWNTFGQVGELPRTMEYETQGCSGCVMSEINDWHKKETPDHGIEEITLSTIKIEDPALDSCAFGVSPTITLNLGFAFFPSENKCNSKATDCSNVKCKANLFFTAFINDDDDDLCAFKGSNLSISVREKAGAKLKKFPSDSLIAWVHGIPILQKSLLKVPFEQDCGDTSGIDLPVITVHYKPNVSAPEKAVPLNINPIDMACSPCTESNSNKKLKQKSNVFLDVFPNPILDNLNVVFQSSTNAKATLRIMNLLGQTVSETEHQLVLGKNHFKVNLEALKNGGAYFYQFNVEGKLHTGRFIKQVL